MPRSRQRVLGGIVTTLVVGGALLAPVAPASAGGALAPTDGGDAGGPEYGVALGPVASRFQVTPARVVEGAALPRMRLRLDEAGVRTLRARIVLWPVGRGGRVVKLDLGRVRTGTTLRPAWPSGTQLAPGSYVVRVHASDAAGQALLRGPGAPGRSALTVVAKPAPPAAPKPVTPAPAPVPAPLAPVTPAGAPGTFPVAGPHTYGDGFGVDRGTHRHEGVDVLAAQGVPLVAPTAGTVRFTTYQARGAGEYVVLRSVAGPDFFFAHCVRGSTRVKPDQVVAEGQPLCAVGQTGDASTPHLHFELWPNGWRTGAKDSVPADPLAQLKAWDR